MALVYSPATFARESNAVNLKYRYAVNLSSSLRPFDPQDIPQHELFKTYRLYQATSITPSKTWYRLRLGYFKSFREAEKVKNKLLNLYPRAWVSVTSEKERRESEHEVVTPRGSVSGKIIAAPEAVAVPEVTKDIEIPAPAVSTEKVKPAAETPAEKPRQAPVQKGKTGDLIEQTRNALTAGEYKKAIQYATALLETEAGKDNLEAIELLGLARERNGQIAHAKAEYERYLKLSKQGEDSRRVQQRLAGLITAAKPATPAPQEMAKEAEKKEEQPKPSWRTLGSLSQYYYRDERAVDEEEQIVAQSDLITTLSLSSRKVTTNYEHRIEFSGDHVYDLIAEEGDDEHETRFSNLYYEMIHRATRRHMRVGRQSHSSGGVLGRFDGINAGVELTERITLDATAGFLLDPEGLFNYESNRKFISANIDFGHIFDRVDFNLYLIRQYADDVLDRYAVGTETRYFDQFYSMFNVIDYDLFYDELNVFLVNNNWVFADSSTFFVNIDFRKSPYLTTYNSVINQTAQTIDDLKNFYTIDEIYQLALDRTPDVKTFSIGGSHPLEGFLEGYGEYQFSGDLTITNTGPMPASGGVEAVEETGNEYFLGAQLIGNNIFKDGDVSIFSIRLGVAQNYDDYTLSLNNRTPFSGRVWRVNPVLQYNRRESSRNSDTRDTSRASIKVEYRPRRNWLIESQIGVDRTRETVADLPVESQTLFFNLGYRWDF